MSIRKTFGVLRRQQKWPLLSHLHICVNYICVYNSNKNSVFDKMPWQTYEHTQEEIISTFVGYILKEKVSIR